MARETPVVLFDTKSFSLDPAAFGKPQVGLDSARLINTYRDPIRVREIGITIQAQLDVDPTPATTLRVMNLGGVVQMNLRTAGRAITNGFVPAWLVSAPIVGLGTRQAGVNLLLPCSEVVVGADWGTILSRAASGTFLRWALPAPLDLAPGQGVAGDLRIADDHGVAELLSFLAVTNLAVDVTVSLLGHFSATTPSATRPVPYVSAALFGPTGPKISDPGALGNAFDVPLEVQRLAGRQYLAAGGTTGGFLDYSAYAVEDAASYLHRATLAAPNGYAAVRDPTPFNQIFAAARRGWNVRSVLADSDDYFQLSLVDAVPADGPALFRRLHAGLIGSRMERF